MVYKEDLEEHNSADQEDPLEHRSNVPRTELWMLSDLGDPDILVSKGENDIIGSAVS